DAYAERFLASASLDSMMPAVQTGSDDAAVPLVTPDKIFRPHEGEDPRQLLTLAVLDVSSEEPELTESAAVRADWANTVYATADSIYVAQYLPGRWWADPESIDRTSILKFQVNEATGEWEVVATGQVPGQVLNQFSLDEY